MLRVFSLQFHAEITVLFVSLLLDMCVLLNDRHHPGAERRPDDLVGAGSFCHPFTNHHHVCTSDPKKCEWLHLSFVFEFI